MTDLVERLRERSDVLVYSSTPEPLMREAADVIERLQAALEIIAGRRQAIDNLMGNQDIAIAALAVLPRND